MNYLEKAIGIPFAFAALTSLSFFIENSITVSRLYVYTYYLPILILVYLLG